MDVDRKAEAELQNLLGFYPAVGLIGPRQVGKTTLAKSLQTKDAVYLDLESAEDRNKLSEPQLYLRPLAGRMVILDEIQYMPELMNELRSLIDEDRRPGRFIVLGSASPALMKKSSDSLDGRIGYIELTPFLQSEVSQLFPYTRLWVRGGFPQSFLAADEAMSFDWRRNFVRSYTGRDLRNLGLDADPILLERFWRMLAGFHSGLWNAENFARSLGITRNTVNHYLNFMESSFLLHRLQPFFQNVKKRLVKSPRVYIRDSGILHYLNNINSFEELKNHYIIGASWEGYAIEQIRRGAGERFQFYFYRTHQGAECDLVLERAGKLAVIEIKYSSAPTLTKGFLQVIGDLQPEKSFIITPGGEEYPASKNVQVVPLDKFLTDHLRSL